MSDEPEYGKVGEEYYTTDAHGARVLVGLTVAETKELEELRRQWWSDHRSKDGTRSYSTVEEMRAARARSMELSEKHQRAWHEFLGAQIALKHKPTIN